MIINKMCNVKAIKEDVDLIIPFGDLLDNGLISNTMVHLEELLMSVNVKIIKYGNPNLEKKLTKISERYEIPIEKIDIRSSEKLKL